MEQEEKALNWKRRDLHYILERKSWLWQCFTLLQRSCGISTSGGSVQDQVGRDFEQPSPMEGIFAHGKGLELEDLQDLFQLKPFWDSMTMIIFNHAQRQSIL